MLQADKQVLLAGVKRNALELRQRELEFHVERYTNLATQASVIAGFSFESLVELEVPEGTHPVLSSFYFIFGSSAMALALYVLCVASFACVFGHRLALQGPHGSLEKAVHILIAHRVHIFATAGISLAFLVCAAVLMAWIKMGYAAAAVTAIFLVFAYAVFARMRLMFDIFHIPEDNLVTGAFRVQDPSSGGVAIDLSHLNPSTATAQHHSMPHGGAYTRVQEVGSSQDGCRCPTNSMSASSVSSLLQTSPTTPRAFPGSPGAKAAAEAAVAIRREGHLFKRAERGLFSNSDRFSRRYFVLKGHQLYYFKTWEDYAAGSIRAAINYSSPWDLRRYDIIPHQATSTQPNRIDLVPSVDPLEKTLELQAESFEIADDWVQALSASKRSMEPGAHVGNATMLVNSMRG